MPRSELLSVGCVLSLLSLITAGAANASPFRRAEVRLKDCRDDVKISLLAGDYGMSEAPFHPLVQSYNGLTPRAYALKYRMEQAKSLLSSSDMQIGDIAEACGFSDALYFSRAFKNSPGSARAITEEIRSDARRKGQRSKRQNNRGIKLFSLQITLNMLSREMNSIVSRLFYARKPQFLREKSRFWNI